MSVEASVTITGISGTRYNTYLEQSVEVSVKKDTKSSRSSKSSTMLKRLTKILQEQKGNN